MYSIQPAELGSHACDSGFESCAGLMLGALGPCWTYAEHARLMLGMLDSCWTHAEHARLMLGMLGSCWAC